MASDSTLTAYRYDDLTDKPRHIRLLHLHHNKEVLSCEIQLADLGEDLLGAQPSYLALSYEWGQPKKDKELRVLNSHGANLGVIPITISLHSALADIIRSDLTPKIVFADQACINQDHIAELNHQVSHMGNVYRQATRVVTYLGPQADGDKEAIALIVEITKHFRPHSSYIQEQRLFGRFITNVEIFKLDDTELRTERIREFMWAGWSRRIWMAPENMLNKHTVFLRGSWTLHWGPLIALHVWQAAGLISPSTALSEACSGRRFSPTAINIWECKAATKAFASLFQCICQFEGDCYDPRDKVYALLALKNDIGIIPDYDPQKSVRATYMDLAIATVKSKVEYSDLLEEAERSPHVQGSNWESWLPDFRTPRHPFKMSGEYHNINTRKEVEDIQFCFNESIGLTSLMAVGLVLDSVDEIYSPTVPDLHQWLVEPKSLDHKSLKSMVSLIESLQSCGYRDEEIVSALVVGVFSRTTTDGMLPHPEYNFPSTALNCLFQLLKQRFADKEPTWDLKRNFQTEELEMARILAYESGTLAIGRKLCVSRAGKLCLVHPDCRPGDFIVDLFKARTLCILRSRDDNHYTFVGTAFVKDFVSPRRASPPYAIHNISIV